MQYKLYNDDFDIIIDSKGCEIISVVMLMCHKVTHKNLIDSSPYYSEN